MSRSDRAKWNERYRAGAYSDRLHPSALLETWISRIPRGRALDVASGAGRNALFLAAHGFDVDAVDISAEAIEAGRLKAHAAGFAINWIERDLDEPIAFESRYALILLVRYVNLPLMRRLIGHLEPGGFLVCEQHLITDADVAGPSSPAFRVAPGVLGEIAHGLHIHLFSEGISEDPDRRTVALARLVAEAKYVNCTPPR